MSRSDHLGAYARGWINGDAEAILGATTDAFVFDDPVRLFTAGNPDFFADTVVAEAAAAVSP